MHSDVQWCGTSVMCTSVMYSVAVFNRGCFQSFGGLLPQTGRGSFWPYKVCTRTIMAIFLHGEAIPAMGMYFNESMGYPGTEVEEVSESSAPVALDVSAQGLESHRFRVLCAQASNVLSIYHHPYLQIVSVWSSPQGLRRLPQVFLLQLISRFYLTQPDKYKFHTKGLFAWVPFTQYNHIQSLTTKH